MIEPKISIIVAAYKVEKYLRKCVDSILNQTYHNIEIILVNDGSPDACGSICDEYAIQDDRVKVIHKENGGQATARNRGLEVASGEYVGFVDGDDWIEPAMYESLLNEIISEQADIVQCEWYLVDSDGNKSSCIKDSEKEIYSSNEALIELILPTGKLLNTSVCCKLFKRNIANSSRFSPVRAYEDDEYVFNTVAISSKIVCITRELYDYYVREGSTMTSSFNLNKLALIQIQQNICNLIKYRLPEYYFVAEKTLCSKQFYILHCLLSNPQIDNDGKEARAIERAIMISYNDYMQNPKMGRNKLMLVLIKYFPKWIWQSVLAIKFS